jgi:prepilin-type N-terminal cleavage/methylation domain-containing protein
LNYWRGGEFLVNISAHLKAKGLTFNKKGFTLKRELINAKRGFTLIELLIVIAILGILAAAVLVAINPAKRQKQARDSKVKSDIGQVATAAQAYFTTSGGSYPDGLGTLLTNEDLKSLPAPPNEGLQGPDYEYDTDPVGCHGTTLPGDIACDEFALYEILEDPATGDIWCFRSFTGQASEVATGTCTAP